MSNEFDPMDEDFDPSVDKPKRGEKAKWGFENPPFPPMPPIPPVPPRPNFSFEFGNSSLSKEEQALADALVRLQSALASLGQTVEHALQTGTYQGVQGMVSKSYQRLHAKAVELLPNDDTITDAIPTEFECVDERECLTQYQIAIRQLAHYLESVIRNVRGKTGGWGDLRNLGKQLSDQILSMTKGVIGRAISDIHIEIGDSHEGENFLGANLEGQDLSKGDYEDATFTGANLNGANCSDANFSDANFAGANLTGANFANANLEDVNMAGVNATDVNFGDANMSDVVLVGANLRGANFQGTNLEDSKLKGINAEGVNFSSANLGDAVLTGANLKGANFSDINGDSTIFTATDLSGANFANANLEGAVFKHANLTGANLRDANLEDANFSGANLSGVDFTDANLDDATMPDGRRYRNGDDLSRFGASNGKKKKGMPQTPSDDPHVLEDWGGANLRGQDLRQFELSDRAYHGTNFTQANLQSVKMSGSDFTGALFIGANLRDTDLRNANLMGVNLAGANMQHADLRGANLQSANVGGTILKGADLRGATLPDGSIYTDETDLSRFGAID